MISKAICHYCGKEFEIDGMSRTEFCPHCGKETSVFTPPPGFAPATAHAAAPAQASPASAQRGGHTLLLNLASGLMFAIGLLMVLGGLGGSITESTLAEQSAIRGIENVCCYGLGFVVVTLSLILSALIRLIHK